MNFPANFFQLLDELYKIQSPAECKTKTRVFGLLQKVHLLLSQEAPCFMQDAYKIWIQKRFKSLPYFKDNIFCTDAHLYPYSDMPPDTKIDPQTIPLFLDEMRWNKIKGLFYFPSKKIGSGNFYTRAVKRAKIFASAYLYKLATGCPWSKVPAVEKGLISGTLARIGYLESDGNCEVVCHEDVLPESLRTYRSGAQKPLGASHKPFRRMLQTKEDPQDYWDFEESLEFPIHLQWILVGSRRDAVLHVVQGAVIGGESSVSYWRR